jgi:hypothetical protein
VRPRLSKEGFGHHPVWPTDEEQPKKTEFRPCTYQQWITSQNFLLRHALLSPSALRNAPSHQIIQHSSLGLASEQAFRYPLLNRHITSPAFCSNLIKYPLPGLDLVDVLFGILTPAYSPGNKQNLRAQACLDVSTSLGSIPPASGVASSEIAGSTCFRLH